MEVVLRVFKKLIHNSESITDLSWLSNWHNFLHMLSERQESHTLSKPSGLLKMHPKPSAGNQFQSYIHKSAQNKNLSRKQLNHWHKHKENQSLMTFCPASIQSIGRWIIITSLFAQCLTAASHTDSQPDNFISPPWPQGSGRRYKVKI